METEVVSVLKGARNGAILGAVIRLPLSLLAARALKLKGGALLQHVAVQVYRGARGVGFFVLTYKLARLVLNLLSGGKGKAGSGINAFISGGAASLVTLAYDPSTTTELLLYLIKLVIEAVAKHGVATGTVPASRGLFIFFNFVFLGLFFYYYERQAQYLKPSLVAGVKRLLAD